MALLTPAAPGLGYVGPDEATASLVIYAFSPPLPSGSDGQVLVDVECRNLGSTEWAPLRGYTGADLAALAQSYLYPRDYEAASGVQRQYRARAYTFDTETGESSAPSAWSPTVGGVVYVRDFWLKCPEQSGFNTRLDVEWTDITFDAPVDRAITYVPGRATPIVDHGVVHAETIQLTVWAPDPATERSIRALHQTNETLLFQADTGQQWYVVIAGTMPRARKPSAGVDPDYSIALTLHEVDVP